jgi:hypothetical protein
MRVVALSASSGYQQLVDYKLTGYPAVTPDGSVVPVFRPNGDLSFVRLNHSSGRVEIASFSRGSGYQNLSEYQLSAYPAVSDYNQLRVISSR